MQYEVEVKSLLGEEENAVNLRNKIKVFNAPLVSRNKQLNHYFLGNSLNAVLEPLKSYFSQPVVTKLDESIKNISDFSVRTRDKDNSVFFVLKASLDNTTSSNGITRIEFEEKVPLTLQELDQLLLDSGFFYQAKWSREREEYSHNDISICLDKNAGYGWLAEFEKIVYEESELENARRDIRSFMKELGVQELQQERLEKMFAFYNANWKDYYGTEKVFSI